MRRSAGSVVVDFAELSDPGRDPEKQVNEDASATCETPLGLLLVVCDGMGGHSHGRKASETAVWSILAAARGAGPSATPPEILGSSIRSAARSVFAVGGDAPLGSRPGTTCVAALVGAHGVWLAHVGDSRAYLLRRGDLAQLTRDHSIVEELVAAGSITREEARVHPEGNKITRALGMWENVEVEVGAEEVPLEPGDTILLCTDGLTDLCTDEEIGSIIDMNVSSGAEVPCERLVNLANVRGGWDNITVQLLHVLAPTAGNVLPTVIDHAASTTPTAPAAPPTVVDGFDAGPGLPVTQGMPPPTLVGGSPDPTLIDDTGPYTMKGRVPAPTGWGRAIPLAVGCALLLGLLLAGGVWAARHWLIRAKDPTLQTPPSPPTSPT